MAEKIFYKLMLGVAMPQSTEPIIITDEDEILITASETSDIYAIGRNGDTTVTFALRNEAQPLPKALKVAGKLTFVFEKIIDGVSVQSWRSVPVILKRVSGEYTAIPELVAMREEFDVMKARIELITKALAETKEILTDPEM